MGVSVLGSSLVPILLVRLVLLPLLAMTPFSIRPQGSTLPDLGHGLQTSFRFHLACDGHLLGRHVDVDAGHPIQFDENSANFPNASLTAHVHFQMDITVEIVAFLLLGMKSLLLHNPDFHRLRAGILVDVSECRLRTIKELIYCPHLQAQPAVALASPSMTEEDGPTPSSSAWERGLANCDGLVQPEVISAGSSTWNGHRLTGLGGIDPQHMGT